TNVTEPINGFFFPDVVPGIQSSTAFSLRVELVSQPYDQVLTQFNSKVKTGDVSAQAYLPPHLNGVTNSQPGLLFKGAINSKFSGEMLVLKVRDKTLELSTLSKDFTADFDNTVLPSLSFAP